MLDIIQQIKDFRRSQGRRYELRYIILFSILAILSNAKSYRDIATFVEINFRKLKKRFKLRWRSPPAYTTIRSIIHGIDTEELEKVFRQYNQRISSLK